MLGLNVLKGFVVKESHSFLHEGEKAVKGTRTVY